MNIEPINFSEFWLYKYVKTLVNIMCDGMIFSARPGQCVGEIISVAHPGQK